MSHLDRPALRPGLAAAHDPDHPGYVFLWDQLRLSAQQQRLSLRELAVVQLFDGERSLPEIQAVAVRQAGGQPLPLATFLALAQRLDEALFLDGPRYRARLSGPVREPSCIGCYDGDPDRLRPQLARLFTGPGGPGLPAQTQPDGALRAALLPHIDYARGAASYGWGFKEVAERTDAALFVIVGTSHYSPARFTLTRQHFRTPLGIVSTDQEYIDRLTAHYGAGLFDDDLAHLPEHSIELEVVLLQFLFEQRRPIRIVPLLVGSFQDCVTGQGEPGGQEDIGRMVAALRAAEAATPEPICYIISGDLAHIGPKFQDPTAVDAAQLAHSRQQDEELLRHAAAVAPDQYFRTIAAEGDRRRICGLPPTWTVLEAIRPRRGRLLHYDQYVHPHGYESVSFASMAFYG